MTAVPGSGAAQVGLPASIAQRQDEPDHLQRLLAYSHHYRVAHWWRRIRATGTVLLAAAGPILAVFVPATGDVVAAISAGWLVLGRTVLTWLEQRSTLDAVRVQELYDTELFRLPWNEGLAGRAPSPDDVSAAARHIRDRKPFLNWYSIDLRNTPWPADVLLCQRQSAVWSRRDHRAYSATVLSAGVAWFAVGLVVALTRDLTLAEYLVKVFLPSAPALLDAAEMSRMHWRHATARQQVEHNIDDLWKANVAQPGTVTVADCRAVQDATYLLRRDGPRVPTWFYKIRKRATDASTRAGADFLTRAPLNGG